MVTIFTPMEAATSLIFQVMFTTCTDRQSVFPTPPTLTRDTSLHHRGPKKKKKMHQTIPLLTRSARLF